MGAQGARRIVTSLVAGASSGNILSGDPLEYPGQPSQVQVAIAADVIGSEATVRFGNEVVYGPSSGVAVEQVAGSGPIIPDNLISEDVIASSDRLSIELFNPTAGTIVVTTWFSVKPV